MHLHWDEFLALLTSVAFTFQALRALRDHWKIGRYSDTLRATLSTLAAVSAVYYLLANWGA